MALCDCQAGLANLGNPACTPQGGIPYKFGFALKRNNLGVPNVIDLSSGVFDEAFWLGLINETNRTERWHFTPEVYNLTWVPQDAANWTSAGGANKRLRKGIVDVAFEIHGVSAQFAGQMEELMCADTQFTWVDNEGSFNGYGQVGGDEIAGVKIAKDSLDVKSVPVKTDATLANVMVKFQLDITTQTKKIVTLPAEDIEYDLIEIVDNTEVVGTTGAVTTTSVVIDLGLIFGTAIAADPVTGLLPADFVVMNVTDNTTVAVLTAPESALVPGQYTVTFAAQTVADVLTISINKQGLDMTPVEFVIP